MLIHFFSAFHCSATLAAEYWEAWKQKGHWNELVDLISISGVLTHDLKSMFFFPRCYLGIMKAFCKVRGAYFVKTLYLI